MIYKIINDIYNVKTAIFDYRYDQSEDEAIRRNYLKEDLGWTSENLHLVTE